MPESRTTIAKELSAQTLTEFLEELARTPGVDGPLIQRLALERFDLDISHNSANTFLRKEFEPYLVKLSKASMLASFIARQNSGDVAGSIADAAAGQLSQVVFEFMMESGTTVDLNTKEGRQSANTLALILRRLRSGDVERERLEAQIEDMRAERVKEKELAEKALKAATTKGGISQETADEILHSVYGMPLKKEAA